MPVRLPVVIFVALFSVVEFVRADPPRPIVRVEPLQPLMADAAPAWLAPAIHKSLSHDLSRVHGIEVTDTKQARLVFRGSVQSANGAIRVNLTLLDDGRAAGSIRATEPVERLFVLQDTLGEQARSLVERSLRRRSDDVAPDLRGVDITFLGPIVVPTTTVRPAFLAPPPTSLDAARLQRGRTYELPTGSFGYGGWHGVPGWYGFRGWYGWPGSCRWLW
jgi:TolB-like protein